jgi:hypothetical protein
MTYTRRDWIRTAALGAAASLLARPALAELLAGEPIAITVYKTPTCGCCKEWVAHLTKNGFKPTVHDLDDLTKIKSSMGVPRPLESCHTAVVQRYTIEGHVPADLIKQLIAQRPRNIAGLAVSGMVQGSPGMETGRKDPYDVIAFAPDGKTSVYARR